MSGTTGRVAAALLAVCALGATDARAADHSARIVGGTPSASGAWPAQAHVTGDQGLVATGCGGTLVSARYVLTAAHCVGNAFGAVLAPSAFTVRLGSDMADRGGQTYAVDAVTRHEGWTSSTTENDLALLHLAPPAPQEPQTLIAEDETALWAPGTAAKVIGWGLTSTNGQGSDVLLEAPLPMVSDDECARAWNDTFKPANQVCAGGGSTDSCQGDSGGPLLVPRGDGFATVGIVSYGTSEGCATPGIPSVYTRIGAPALNQWIRARVPTLRIRPSVAGPRAGTAVTLTADASGAATAAAGQIVWDLDGDGAFDDATGATAPVLFAAGRRTVRAAVALPDGDRAVARTTIEVRPARTVPAGVAANGRTLAAIPDPFAAPAGGAALLRTQIARPARTFALPRLRGSRLRATIACATACSARATLVVSAATARSLGLRSRTIGTGTAKLAGARVADVTVRVPTAVRRKLLAPRVLRGELRIRVRADGRTLSRTAAVTGRATR
ncbi:trypsin-like serine protease [Conexibacter sp. W3-3-2]|uniref:serine protease n=1 Tax=Conexibacter sp. W3-3-2 TaxID=2675227 RepID=UPI0012BA1760|nr:serine protease [Conexibacter sp. W3-3-2]MTD46626.1 trypsin-like serine protease [Conexibacter sp. W3-3-2]